MIEFFSNRHSQFTDACPLCSILSSNSATQRSSIQKSDAEKEGKTAPKAIPCKSVNAITIAKVDFQKFK